MNRIEFKALPQAEQLQRIEAALQSASAADIFGVDDLKVYRWRNLAQITHPDHNPDNLEAATRVFARLQALKDGDSVSAAPDASKQIGDYTITRLLGSGDIADVYLTQNDHFIIKRARELGDRDLIENEAHALMALHIWPTYNQIGAQFVPHLIVSATDDDGLPYNVLWFDPERFPPSARVFTLAQLGQAGKLDAKAVGWIFKRLIGAVTYAHDVGVIHAAVVPDNILIWETDESSHGIALIDWCYASQKQERLRALPKAWEALYPPEVRDGNPAQPSLDLYLAGRSIEWATRNQLLPAPMREMIDWCTWPSEWGRPDDFNLLSQRWDHILFIDLGWPHEFVRLETSNESNFDWSWFDA